MPTIKQTPPDTNRQVLIWQIITTPLPVFGYYEPEFKRWSWEGRLQKEGVDPWFWCDIPRPPNRQGA